MRYLATIAAMLDLSGCGLVDMVANHEPCYTESRHYLRPKICDGYAEIRAKDPKPRDRDAGSYSTESSGEEATGYEVRELKDRHGLPRGTIETRPDGETVIKDRWGIKQGTVEPARY